MQDETEAVITSRSQRKAAASFKRRDVSLPQGNSFNAGYLRFIRTVRATAHRGENASTANVSPLSGSSFIAQ